jgi:hypothetical protein
MPSPPSRDSARKESQCDSSKQSCIYCKVVLIQRLRPDPVPWTSFWTNSLVSLEEEMVGQSSVSTIRLSEGRLPVKEQVTSSRASQLDEIWRPDDQLAPVIVEANIPRHEKSIEVKTKSNRIG